MCLVKVCTHPQENKGVSFTNYFYCRIIFYLYLNEIILNRRAFFSITIFFFIFKMTRVFSKHIRNCSSVFKNKSKPHVNLLRTILAQFDRRYSVADDYVGMKPKQNTARMTKKWELPKQNDSIAINLNSKLGSKTWCTFCSILPCLISLWGVSWNITSIETRLKTT